MTARYCTTCRTVHPRIHQAVPVDEPTLRDTLILVADLGLSILFGLGVGLAIVWWWTTP